MKPRKDGRHWPLGRCLLSLGGTRGQDCEPGQQNMRVFWMLKRRRKRSARMLSGIVPLILVLWIRNSVRPVAALRGGIPV